MQKRGNTMYKKAVVLLMFLMILPCASALRLQFSSDTGNKIFFEPNLAREITFTVSEVERVATVPISISGNLAKYASVEPTELSMSPGEKKEVKLKIRLPEDVPKGINRIEISAKEIPANAPTSGFIWMPGIGITLKIINTDVDYDCGLSMFNAEISANSARVNLGANNDGRKAIEGAYADLAVYDAEGMSIASWKTPSFSIPEFDSGSIQSSTALQNVPPGYYTIKGALNCAGKKIEVNREVINAASELKITNFRAFKQDGNLHVEFDLENDFLAPIEATAMTTIYNGETELDRYSMSGASVPPLGKATIKYPVPISGLRVTAGTHTITGNVAFGGKNHEFKESITFTEDDVSKKATSGFGVTLPQQPEEAPTQIVLEQPSSEGMGNKTLIRIIAGVLILILITIFILKVLAAKRD